MSVSIVQDGDPVLRQTAQPVPEDMFGTPKLAKMVKDMAAALDEQPDGVAIAAPQIGLPWRVFLVRYDRVRPPVPEGEPEPEAWTITVEDPIPIRQGSPGIYGNSVTTLYFDNVQVTPKSTK